MIDVAGLNTTSMLLVRETELWGKSITIYSLARAIVAVEGRTRSSFLFTVNFLNNRFIYDIFLKKIYA